MKKLLLFIASVIISTVHAEQYQAPSVELKNDYDLSNSKPKQENWDSNFRVQEEAESDRFLASEEEEQKRGPSSEAPKTEKKDQDKMKAWPLMD